ncbi:class I SAM-dependent methyltransferase [Roseococcus sp. SYP-B2431]|uniref:class I SAM-dependent methyltransferase n=1 Tax=Roseococcus sp. SYP-B2431 TaxID=2496640 RepID=UPI0013F4B509|nr:class I SAM-dependent methyltransferase [Roseococcus sp. SYP-B2431]
MSAATDARIQPLIERYYPPATHPYQRLAGEVRRHLRPDATVLEIGCGRGAPMLSTMKGQAGRLIGIDVVEFTAADPDLELWRCDVTAMTQIADGSIDLAFSRSVMEHIEDVDRAYAEIGRVLAPGGTYVFLTPNFWDYASLISAMVPNALHGRIVRATEGREEEDVFPTHYRSNTARSIRRLAAAAGLSVQGLQHLGQYPTYFRFSPTLFRLGCLYGKLLERFQPLHGLQGWIFCELRKAP